MKNTSRQVYVSLVSGLLIASSALPCLAAAIRTQVIEYDNGNPNPPPVNDLTLRFSSAVTAVTLVTSNGKSVKADSIGNNGLEARFDANSFGEVMNGGKVTIKSETATGADVTSNSVWSDNGMQLNGVTLVGTPMGLLFDTASSEEFALFVNQENAPVIYSNIILYKNNDISNFNIDQAFLLPTGELIPPPGSFVLGPGENVLLSFGVVDLTKYELAEADAATITNPGNLFRVGTADAPVPEPSTVLLVISGLVLLRFHWRRRSSHRPG
jgi:hypothetical protein